jgi:hypothetical protein
VIKCIKTKKIVKNEFNLCCKGVDPRIYENSIFSVYVPKKKKTPCKIAMISVDLESAQQDLNKMV